MLIHSNMSREFFKESLKTITSIGKKSNEPFCMGHGGSNFRGPMLPYLKS